ncbi:uncharacterized protein Z519_07840 [Cladophialophora bantiana CBS 173.52]|uniref:Uncharacterized protein n=1 Tax=Cladophialophora bantiana (strain ATCC 10958 / CBS 173.52 / CDC B-1940 / NIH 8579) TaxID=1442370 RepID=A0A0D2HM36_CLAB1|nr:uncharacterized protein Z519_07840 [Cladophialophora bantiana CBS 173.52]KIW91870.1 hypothetical protein Z519_07840 [Cladophialophora bantiana CBS 173.52]
MPFMYAFGSNGSGQLGIGHTEDVSRPERCLFRTHERGENSDHGLTFDGRNPLEGSAPAQVCDVKKIVAGGNHTLLLTTDGRLFIAGNTGMARVVAENVKSDRSVVFEEITDQFSTLGISRRNTGPRNVVTDIAATWGASFAVVDGKAIVGWGVGTKGELGLGPGVTSTNGQVMKLFEADLVSSHGEAVEILNIEGGVAHVVVLLSHGRVYGWGSCRKGQLGERLKAEKIVWTPRSLGPGVDEEDLMPWMPERVTLGREYTVFVKTGRRPVVWGDTKFFDQKDLKWTVEEEDTVASGWSSIHILSRRLLDPSLQGAGRNDHGQLPPAGLALVQTLAAGSEHCIALSEDNEVIAWGWGEHGNCGEELDPSGDVIGRYNVIPLPKLDEDIFARNVAAGCATSFVICGKKDG